MGEPQKTDSASTEAAQHFITRWSGVTASELSTAQSFLRELCDLLGVEPPHPTEAQDYMFERPIPFQHGDGSTSAPLALEALESHFKSRAPWKKSLPRILETLEALGRAKREGNASRS